MDHRARRGDPDRGRDGLNGPATRSERRAHTVGAGTARATAGNAIVTGRTWGVRGRMAQFLRPVRRVSHALARVHT